MNTIKSAKNHLATQTQVSCSLVSMNFYDFVPGSRKASNLTLHHPSKSSVSQKSKRVLAQRNYVMKKSIRKQQSFLHLREIKTKEGDEKSFWNAEALFDQKPLENIDRCLYIRNLSPAINREPSKMMKFLSNNLNTQTNSSTANVCEKEELVSDIQSSYLKSKKITERKINDKNSSRCYLKKINKKTERLNFLTSQKKRIIDLQKEPRFEKCR